MVSETDMISLYGPTPAINSRGNLTRGAGQKVRISKKSRVSVQSAQCNCPVCKAKKQKGFSESQKAFSESQGLTTMMGSEGTILSPMETVSLNPIVPTPTDIQVKNPMLTAVAIYMLGLLVSYGIVRLAIKHELKK